MKKPVLTDFHEKLRISANDFFSVDNALLRYSNYQPKFKCRDTHRKNGTPLYTTVKGTVLHCKPLYTNVHQCMASTVPHATVLHCTPMLINVLPALYATPLYTTLPH